MNLVLRGCTLELRGRSCGFLMFEIRRPRKPLGPLGSNVLFFITSFPFRYRSGIPCWLRRLPGSDITTRIHHLDHIALPPLPDSRAAEAGKLQATLTCQRTSPMVTPHTDSSVGQGILTRSPHVHYTPCPAATLPDDTSTINRLASPCCRAWNVRGLGPRV